MNMPRPIPIIGTASVSPIIMKNLDCRNGASSGCLAIPSINLLPKIPTPIPAGIGVGILGSKFIEGIARQPELAPFLQSKFFIMMGLTDAVPMIGIGLGMFMLFVL